MDVKALYTSIPNNEGIAAVQRKQDNYTKKTVATKVITTFLALILTLNNFIFNSKFYLQIKGCAMGTICTPTHANIFMREIEEKYYPLIQNKSRSYLCFIDNIFMVWTKSENELKGRWTLGSDDLTAFKCFRGIFFLKKQTIQFSFSLNLYFQ